ncbi:MAG: sodium/nucleoside symporter family protein [Proteobacteria bacterium]|nr:sodium/nucleoside symporter family protein [Pseudomonadota bacterium]
MQGAAGLSAILVFAWLISENRRRVSWRTVLAGLALTFAFALLLSRLTALQGALAAMNDGLAALEKATQSGTAFVFGYLGGGPAPFAASDPAASFILAFRALPLVLVISALSALLFHWGILPWIVRLFARLLQKTMGLGGAVGVSAAANVFVGMVEAPLVIRPYLVRLTRGELFIVMVCGMATIAGTVLVLYASILGPAVPGALAHLLIASLVSTPAAIVIAALMVPGESSSDDGLAEITASDRSAMDAITRGTLEGLELLLNIVAMLVVFVALVSLANAMLGLLPDVGGHSLTLERILGWVLAPLAWACGVPWSEAQVAGALLGKKTVLNELIAYLDMAKLPTSELSPRSKLLMTYALCGFANFGSLGILLGGMGAMVPERRGELVELGLKSIIAGLLATCLTAAVMSVVL